MLDEKELISLLTFNSFSYKSIKFYNKLKEDFKSLSDAFKEVDLHYFVKNRFPKSFVEEFLSKKDLEFGKHELDKVNKHQIKILSIEDRDYPVNLSEIHSAPLLLYVKGQIMPDSINFAIVGTRKPTQYGIKMASKLSYELSRVGMCIISGLARGIDTVCHEVCVRNKSKTCAVLGSGLLNIYPPENRKLAQDIVCDGGALLSEYPLETEPLTQNFPARNRIISGLSIGILVIEAPVDSGALITANWAVEQNRNVFVIPGRIDTEQSLGCLKLAQEGAKIVISLQDILDEYPDLFKNTFPSAVQENNKTDQIHLSDIEKTILKIIENEVLSFDEIFYKVQIPMQKLNITMLNLEMKGIIKKLAGNRYTKN